MSFWRTPLNCRPAEAALWPSVIPICKARVIPSAARNLALRSGGSQVKADQGGSWNTESERDSSLRSE